MEITYNPASLRPAAYKTPEPSNDNVMKAMREAWENTGTSAQHMATSVQHAATTMAKVMACFEESETPPE